MAPESVWPRKGQNFLARSRSGRELKKSDVWSLGVVVFMMLCARQPFNGRDRKELLDRIVAGNTQKLRFPRRALLSKSFVTSLMCYNIEQRMSAEHALQHRWITRV